MTDITEFPGNGRDKSKDRRRQEVAMWNPEQFQQVLREITADWKKDYTPQTRSEARRVRVARIVEDMFREGEALAKVDRLTDEYRLKVLREEIEEVEARLAGVPVGPEG